MKSMMAIDPKRRPTAKELLQHEFFSLDIADETLRDSKAAKATPKKPSLSSEKGLLSTFSCESSQLQQQPSQMQ